MQRGFGVFALQKKKKSINQIVTNSKYVYGFERTADTVFFCGVKHGSGVVGFFEESVFAGAGNVHISYRMHKTIDLNNSETCIQP